MVYLLSQMALFLILAALAGMGVGWWSNQLRSRPSVINEPNVDDMFAIKRRLDACFDDNAKLRRNLKSSDSKLLKLSKKAGANDSASGSRLTDKVSVLMDDLQLRDDTITALEKELELARTTN